MRAVTQPVDEFNVWNAISVSKRKGLALFNLESPYSFRTDSMIKICHAIDSQLNCLIQFRVLKIHKLKKKKKIRLNIQSAIAKLDTCEQIYTVPYHFMSSDTGMDMDMNKDNGDSSLNKVFMISIFNIIYTTNGAAFLTMFVCILLQ